MARTRRTRRARRARKTRRVRRARIRGGEVSEKIHSQMDHIRHLLHGLFPELNNNQIEVNYVNESIHITLKGCKEEKNLLSFKPEVSLYSDNTMYIDKLTSCSPISGTEMLRRFITLARQVEVKSIALEDASRIYFPPDRYGQYDCAVDLAILRILQKGQSWYESLGFVSPITEEDRAENERVRKMPFSAFLEKLREKEKEKRAERRNYIRRHYASRPNRAEREIARMNEKPSEIEGIMEAFPEVDEGAPVHQAIQQMIDRVNRTENSCESVPFHILKALVRICTETDDPLIHYDADNLVMML